MFAYWDSNRRPEASEATALQLGYHRSSFYVSMFTNKFQFQFIYLIICTCKSFATARIGEVQF